MLGRTGHKGLLVLLLLAVVAAAGCDKAVKVTFYNQTSQSRDVLIVGPGSGTGFIGTVQPMGTVKTKIKIDKDVLPKNYTWEAGDRQGSFSIDDDSPGKLSIDIESGVAVDKNTEFQKTKKFEAKDVIIDTDTVVE